ncbi:MAG TPA: glycosyltransferase family 39 protein [Chloroflexota bacterium]|nr:glycosyltransferase family 39 protein [Chloroflexota bacterium]
MRFYRLDALPLGFHHDEGLDAVAALEVWTKGQHPIFFPQSGSREPLMIYLESLSILALGATRLGARAAQACVGTAGVVAAWFLFRALFGRRVALLGAAIMGFSFWQMFESRLGLRAISQPLFETLCLLFFWRTLTQRRWPDAVLAGLFLGATMYTYTASRALPLLLAALVLWQLAVSPAFLAKQWTRMLVVAGLGLAVCVPLGLYAARHPEEFFGRSLQVNLLNPQPFTGAAQAGGVGPAVLRTLGMFSIEGDPAWKYNIGGQPVFDWPISALFYGGIVLAVVGTASWLRQLRRDRTLPSPHAFVLLWLVIMLLPGFLSGEAPHFLRTIGIMPAVFVLPALALSWLVERWRWLLPLAGVLLATEGAETGYRYFQQWARSSDAYYGMHADAADVAAYLEQSPGHEPVLFSSEYPGHPTVLYLAPHKFEDVRWFNGRESMAFPPPGQDQRYVFTARYQPPFLDLARLFSPNQIMAEGRDPEGGVAYRIYHGSPMAPEPPARIQAELGGLARLDGAAFPPSARAGQALHVQEYWHALRQGTPDVRAFLHLVDGQGHVWAQADSLGYYAEDWQPGDAAINDQTLELPADAPPLTMRLLFGLYSASSGQQLEVRDASGAAAGTQIALGTIQVQPGSGPAPDWRPPHAMARQLAPGLELIGYELPQANVRAGDRLTVDLFWRVTGALRDVPQLSIQGGAGWQESGLTDLLPAAQWPPGILEDRRQLSVPPATRSGTAAVAIGDVKLGDVTISEPRRQFDAPAVQHQLDVPVGDFATLSGYSLEPGRPLRLTLVWRDRTPTSASYKVFVHMLDERSQVIVQKDDFPQAGGMPTTFWVPNQVIEDRYELALPSSAPAGAQLEIGMYEPVSGKRLPIGRDDHLLLPLNS